MCDTARDAELRVPTDLVYLRAVRGFVKELAVDEVFTNAVEHATAGSGSRIAIHCLSTDEMVRITVSDTGQGRGTNAKWLDAWSDVVKGKIQPWAQRGRGLLLEPTRKPDFVI